MGGGSKELHSGLQFHTLFLEIGQSAAQKYTTPGQYLQVRLKGGKPGFYALASTPEEAASGTVELLVRCRGENSEELCNIADSEAHRASKYTLYLARCMSQHLLTAVEHLLLVQIL